MDKVPQENCKSRKIAADDRLASTMDHLPYEIRLNILSRLPIASLLRATLVSRSWKNLIQDPVLAHLHFSLMSVKDPSIILHCNFPLPTKLYFAHNSDRTENGEKLKRIVLPSTPNFFNIAGSCNGLICLYDLLHKTALYVFNPFSRNFLELPKAVQLTRYDDVSFGFGFIPTTKEYKVVRIVYYSISKSNVQILNLGRSSWRSIGQISYELERKPSHALVNGRLHWLTLVIEQEPLQIVSLDLEDENFRIVPEPNCIFFRKYCSHLVILKGCLSLAAFSSELLLDIWIMKEYGVKESWTKSFKIGACYLPKELIETKVQSFIDLTYVRILCLLENGEILLNYKGEAQLLYDPNSCILKKLMLLGQPEFFQPLVHISSLHCVDSISHT